MTIGCRMLASLLSVLQFIFNYNLNASTSYITYEDNINKEFQFCEKNCK